MIRRPPRSTLSSSSAASDVYKRQVSTERMSTQMTTQPRPLTLNPTSPYLLHHPPHATVPCQTSTTPQPPQHHIPQLLNRYPTRPPRPPTPPSQSSPPQPSQHPTLSPPPQPPNPTTYRPSTTHTSTKRALPPQPAIANCSQTLNSPLRSRHVQQLWHRSRKCWCEYGFRIRVWHSGRLGRMRLLGMCIPMCREVMESPDLSLIHI